MADREPPLAEDLTHPGWTNTPGTEGGALIGTEVLECRREMVSEVSFSR